MTPTKLRINIHKLFSEHPRTKELSGVVAEFDVEAMDDQGNVIATAPVKIKGKVGMPDESGEHYIDIQLASQDFKIIKVHGELKQQFLYVLARNMNVRLEMK
jgi:hypothetical protein